MDKYYYFIAQLPTLQFDKESYMTVETFMGEAEKWLSRADYVMLASIKLNDVEFLKAAPAVLRDYREFEYRVRNDTALWRKARKAGQEYKPEFFPLALIKDGTPLEIEKKMLRLRWNFIDELERTHHFDLGFLLLYMLKLLLLQQLFTYDEETGKQNFLILCEVEA